ncbi:5-dehydro-4-deoxy-D-glucuronate isomerase [Xanthobacter dioxanivorans]|uniref:4-deoxy-L-threo-5-hexosulose-uronate ketol-isomerase n=1 Tax=Xanthobacter dioxanivorans TaxID=2528964 RepID=A0A974PTQ5_9HYPH|nr:5-dehydro-4-deoxy-D-glucuronate isomerase [Xanthobacter dioxanivorans]QRG09229.1 5-dehydro-4-deoxy-D-glucuronate isomerase [Xanthobacter dioxanivorans]
MMIDVRHVHHQDAAKGFDTAALRRNYLVERLFEPGKVLLTYSHVERFVIGGATPASVPLKLESDKATIGSPNFLDRRELGVFNIGGAGTVSVDGVAHPLGHRDALYVPMGTREVVFASDDPDAPARFYLLSTPAHARYETKVVRIAEAKRMPLGDTATANKRTIYQMIHPDVVTSCQLVMGMTQLDEGNVWNTMPCHVHDRRSEVYLYFDLPADARVIHLMGEPDETRHVVVADGQAVISPPWSIHSGCGTRAYTFIWGMGGDNIDYTDMDMVPMGELK